MKKMLFNAAIIAATLSSCSQNEIATTINDTPQAIGFGTYVGNASTKAESETGFEATDAFFVDAYYTAKESAATAMGAAATVAPASFMQNQKVIAAAGETSALTWSYSPIKYWPNNTDDMVSFFAVTNATATSPITDFEPLAATKAPSFTVANATSDIMIASLLNQKKPTTDAITFTFAHTMAQVNFNAKLSAAIDTNTTVKVTSLTVAYTTGGFTGGTFTYSTGTNNTGVWSDGNTKRGANEFNSTNESAGIGTSLNASDRTTIGAPLMILPNAEASYDVTVVYTVTTTDEDSTVNNSTITNTCKFRITPTTMNKIYTYALEIGLNEVKVISTITGWDSTDAGNTVTVNSTTGVLE